MESIFLHLVNMSITAGWLVLAVVLFRLVFHRVPKWIHCLLWVLVAVRLVCPFSFESVLSLIPSAETVPVEEFLYDTPAIHSGVPVVDNVVNPIISNGFAPQPMDSVNPMQVLSTLAAYVWVLGMVMMALYMVITTLQLRWRVRESVRLQRNIFQCDRIATPFILGVVRPRIYLPTTLSEGDILSVVAHEEAHIQRRDHWWKPLGFLLLTVYWFNPLLWLGYVLLCRDIEAACDEKVIKDMDVSQRKSYSSTLLACSAPRHLIAACPLAFGETGVKSRIKAVLNYKKPAFWLIMVAVVAAVVVAVCLLTDPKPTMSDELDAYLTHVILEHNYSEEHTGDAYPTEAHTVFGVEKKAGKTVVYGMVLYEEYYLDENGALQVQSGSHIPTVITVDVEGNGYSLVEYWIPRDGTDYATDIREKYPIWYWWQTDTQRHVDKHQQKTLADADAHFKVNSSSTVNSSTTVSTTQKTTSTQMADTDANTFTGKVTQVTGKGGTMLMECYDTSKFTEVSVSLRNFPEMLPQVGEEYVVTHDGMVMETYPPQIVAVAITPVSSKPTQATTSAAQATSFITEAEAIAIASEYWKVKPGDRDPDTGFLMSIHAMETPTEEKPHYRMALRWLVETEGGTGNFSTLDTIYIHAETGEIALPGGTTAVSTVETSQTTTMPTTIFTLYPTYTYPPTDSSATTTVPTAEGMPTPSQKIALYFDGRDHVFEYKGAVQDEETGRWLWEYHESLKIHAPVCMVDAETGRVADLRQNVKLGINHVLTDSAVRSFFESRFAESGLPWSYFEKAEYTFNERLPSATVVIQLNDAGDAITWGICKTAGTWLSRVQVELAEPGVYPDVLDDFYIFEPVE